MITRIRVEGTNGSPAALQDDFERVTLALLAHWGGIRVGEDFYEYVPGNDQPAQYKGRRVIYLPQPTDDTPNAPPDDEIVVA